MITREDVYKLAKDDPVLHQCVKMYEYQQCSWEEAMMLAATSLAHQKGVLEKELVKLHSRTIPPIILIDKNCEWK